MERGLGPKGVKGYGASRTLLMTPDWIGALALSDMIQGSLDEATAQVSRICSIPVVAEITTRFSDTTHVASVPRREGAIKWNWVKGRLHQDKGEAVSLPHEIRAGLDQAHTFTDVARAIQANEHAWEFLWCNLFVSLRVPPESLGELHPILAARWLEPWMPWVRPA